MPRDHWPKAGSRPTAQSPTRGVPADKSGPMLSASSSNNHSLFSFGRSNGSSTAAGSNSRPSPPIVHNDDDLYLDGEDDVADRTTSYDFLPSVSFDDLQSSLESASTEFKLSQFPSPTGQGSILDAQAATEKLTGPSSSAMDASFVNSSVNSSAARPPAAAAVAATAGVSGARSVAANATTTTTRIAIPPSSLATTTTGAPRISKSGSILRRPSVTGTRQSSAFSTASAASTNQESITVPASSRQRRQSHYPPVSNTNIANMGKPPRKSVGPGAFDAEYTVGIGRSGSRRRPSMASNSDRPVPGSARSSIDGGSRPGGFGGDTARNVNGSRASKVRSFQHSSSRASISGAVDSSAKAPGSGFQRPPRTVSHSSSIGSLNGSVATGGANASTKAASFAHSAAAKRMSMAPALHPSHATGLGARTVSPTDARRMKRMSVMPTANGSSNTAGGNAGNGSGSASRRDAVQTSNMPLPPSSEFRASSRSPSMLPRKTSTPSSSRTTPDLNRKSYSSGFSVGSSMSFNTVRSSTGSIQPRLGQGAASGSISGVGSRLPAPKALAVHTSAPNADDDEDVPPVPAIPKVYESPKDPQGEMSFLEKHKASNLALDGSSTHSSSTASVSSSHPALGLDPPAKIQPNASTLAAKDTTPLASSNKKNLQPLRLPPINLMPLSTPTAAKIAALQEQSAAAADRNISPPPSRVVAKTPTTPMTASKGTFFSRHRNEDRADPSTTLRSSSSIYHHTRIDSVNGGDDTAASDFFSAAMPMRKSSFYKPSASPFLSTSAPTSKTPAEDSDSAYATPSFVTPIPPPIPAAVASEMRRPSGPRAPAPTPSRAFAPLESASTIITSADSSYMMDPMPASTFITVPAPKSPPPLSSPDEPPTPSSIGSSLRRKLSLSWKRGTSKSSLGMQGTGGSVSDKPEGSISSDHKEHHGLSHQRQASSVDKHDGMPPPPRIPKSVTLGQFASGKKSPSATMVNPTKPPGIYLESRRRKSSASSLNAILAHDKAKTDAWSTGDRQHKKDGLSAMPGAPESRANTGHAHHSHPHASSVMHKILKTKPSSASIRQHDMWTAELDTDDLVAEEEIRKLGSRRKETELAARTLDALRKRATPKERVSAQEATRIAMLNLYERGEIVDYNDVYFCGTQNAAKVVGSLDSDKTPNFGYDDERGDYAIVPGDHLAYRYEIIDLLGKGSFGQVVRCIDHKTGVLVAVKIIRNKKRFHQQALVEVDILQKLREWDPQNKHSMVNFTHSFYFRGHLCISTELLDMNLYEFIKANAFRGFSLKLIRRFTKQMLSSLNLLKEHKVIHCDLKPENILLRHPLHTEIKVIDFGSSCYENERVYTYIQSRFYRSPEVILGMTYGMPIDMWSLGCILAELFTGVPIFPGENEQEQLACIMEVFGPPEKHLIEKSTRKKLFFDSMGKPRLTVSSKGRRRRPSSKTLQQVIKCDDEAFLDFLSRCLRWDPDRRLKPDEAINHHFITGQKAVIPPPLPRSSLHGLHHRDGSPVRRHHTISISGAGGPRPLPEPPAAGLGKLGAPPTLRTGGARESLGAGSHKSLNAMSTSRRTSGVASTTSSIALGKRTSTTIATSGFISGNSTTGPTSNLPRASGRVVSGGALGGSTAKPDLAAAGAAAAMTRRA